MATARRQRAGAAPCLTITWPGRRQATVTPFLGRIPGCGAPGGWPMTCGCWPTMTAPGNAGSGLARSGSDWRGLLCELLLAGQAGVTRDGLIIADAKPAPDPRAHYGSRWRPVLDQMRRPVSGPLAGALSTPWRLTLAATVYDQRDAAGAYLRDPADLTRPQLDTEDAARDHLLALFIPATLAAHKGPYQGDHVHRWLAVLASYLGSNTSGPDRPPREVAGRTLSGTDLVLHELWPLAGSRAARAVTVGTLAAFAAAGIAAFLFARVPIGFTRSPVLGAIVLGIAAVTLLRYSWTAWPQIHVIDLRQLRTRQSRRTLIGPGGTIVAGTVLVAGTADDLSILLALGITFALAIGLAMGLAVALSTAFRRYTVADTRRIIRTTYVAGIIAGLAMGLVAGLAIGPVAGLAIGLAAGLVAGLAGIRYIAFLMCTRRWSDHWLSWRLGRFLHWCYEAGLIRIAGIGYQFRHQELQDYLACNPHPVSAEYCLTSYDLGILVDQAAEPVPPQNPNT